MFNFLSAKALINSGNYAVAVEVVVAGACLFGDRLFLTYFNIACNILVQISSSKTGQFGVKNLLMFYSLS